jgi:hypothetical protein
VRRTSRVGRSTCALETRNVQGVLGVNVIVFISLESHFFFSRFHHDS